MLRRFAATALSLVLVTTATAALSPEVEKALREAKYVYIQSERKSGEFSKPAEIWFFYDDGAVWVGTSPTSFRVRRIKAGRKKARIAVGRRDGPSFEATGELVKDAAAEERLMSEFARKYPEGWERFSQKFREGFKSGERVLVRYRPK